MLVKLLTLNFRLQLFSFTQQYSNTFRQSTFHISAYWFCIFQQMVCNKKYLFYGSRYRTETCNMTIQRELYIEISNENVKFSEKKCFNHPQGLKGNWPSHSPANQCSFTSWGRWSEKDFWNMLIIWFTQHFRLSCVQTCWRLAKIACSSKFFK